MTTKMFLGVLLLVLSTAMASALIVSPTNQQYTGPVPVNITANETQDSLTFSVGSYAGSCTNCSSLDELLNFSNGNYTLVATAVLGNNTVHENVTFSVLLPVVNETNTTNQTNSTNPGNQTNVTAPADFTITVHAPVNTTYNASVPVQITTNRTVSSLAYTVGGQSNSCTNCSAINETRTLPSGNYTLVATAVLGNVSKSTSISFRVQLPATTGNQTNQTNTTAPNNQTNSTPKNDTPRFTAGLNKLPKMVESGEINDTELAKIIRESEVNPGVLNRLIKTGKLGNASITAIIETQEPPQGIFRKLFGWTGFFATPKEKLVETYQLTAEQETKLLQQELPKKTKEKVEEKLGKKESPGQAKKEEKIEAEEKAETKPGKEEKTKEEKPRGKSEEAKEKKDKGPK